ncbi:hypothetical protein [Methanospirillum lacunae]|uniref:Uncharacterized protein n=1 Tax=Methanospirillum lacunae TaxID=668570 RepID=A0A2V2N347_9EURY|nr:hypothetical protein [Methanospirillum lacunae]PWR70958.1 hypothetical protein DK846_13315 [Methanospirillum lacunae]
MIREMLSGVLGGVTIVNILGLVFLYQQYMKLASSSIEFAALVVESVEEQKDGSITVDPLALAATSMDHISQLSGLLKLIRF